MSETKESQRLRYPLPVYNFRVTVDGQAMSFAEVSGIAVNYESVTYRHGLSFLEGERIQTFAYDRFMPITLKRGTILGAQPTFLYDWLTQRDLRSLVVSLCDEKGIPVFSWKVAAAVPVSLKAPAFSATAKDVAIDSLELQARGVTVEKI